MEKLNYCSECKRIFNSGDSCIYCNSTSVKQLNIMAPVNVIGTKLKGRVFKSNLGIVQVLTVDEHRKKSIKDFDASKLRKIL